MSLTAEVLRLQLQLSERPQLFLSGAERMQTLAKLRTWLARWQRPKTLGQRGEAAAARFLKRRGYRIVARAARGDLGELDLVAVDGRTVVFVEVKTRRSHEAGHPADAVDERKQQRLTRLALAYMKRHDLLGVAARRWRLHSFL